MGLHWIAIQQSTSGRGDTRARSSIRRRLHRVGRQHVKSYNLSCHLWVMQCLIYWRAPREQIRTATNSFAALCQTLRHFCSSVKVVCGGGGGARELAISSRFARQLKLVDIFVIPPSNSFSSAGFKVNSTPHDHWSRGGRMDGDSPEAAGCPMNWCGCRSISSGSCKTVYLMRIRAHVFLVRFPINSIQRRHDHRGSTWPKHNHGHGDRGGISGLNVAFVTQRVRVTKTTRPELQTR